MHRLVNWLVVGLWSGAMAVAPAAAQGPAGMERLGDVTFPISCAAEVQVPFNRGIALLHSFEYGEAERVFRDVVSAAPACLMAEWGIAMSLWNPLWAPPTLQELTAGRAAVARAKALTEATERERAYLDVVDAFYRDDSEVDYDARAHAANDRMAAVYAAYPDDIEAAAFYGLTLLATASPLDASYAHQYKAASLLHWVQAQQPRHPGAAHYLIHAYDAPELARLGLAAALAYAEIAPDSAHAQHMPSHIFTRLGRWEDVARSNEDASASGRAYAARAALPGHFDEELHSLDYLMYAYLQMARDDQARTQLEYLRTIEATHPTNFKVAYAFAAMPARFALERGDWREAGGLPVHPVGFPWTEFGWAASIRHFARGLGSARLGDLAAARLELAAIAAIRAALPAATLPYWATEVEVQHQAVEAWIDLAEGRTQTAVEGLRAAADREDAVAKHPVTPGEVVPARELLAEMLLALDRPAEAQAEFEKVLRVAPQRFRAVYGIARAARQLGDAETARAYYSRLVEAAGEGNVARLEVQEALAFAPTR